MLLPLDSLVIAPVGQFLSAAVVHLVDALDTRSCSSSGLASPGRTCSATSASRAPPASRRRGWRRLDARLAGGDTLVVVAIDRIGRTWQDTIRSICSLRDRGVKIRSLAKAEAQWTQYLEADEGSPESFFGQVLVMFAAWVADQELESIKRRTRDGLERARQQGKTLGPPRKVGPGQLATMREGGASLRRIAGDFDCSPSTVLRALRREGVAP